MSARETISAEEFDRKFDDGEDVSAYVDWSKARRVDLEARRVNVDFPAWVVAGLDQEARRLGVTRQALIKLWIAERAGGGSVTGGRDECARSAPVLGWNAEEVRCRC